MKEIIYVKLLGEGTIVYRPVSAIKIESNIYKLEGHDIYNTENETWEFEPGTQVVVQSKSLEGQSLLVATEKKVIP